MRRPIRSSARPISRFQRWGRRAAWIALLTGLTVLALMFRQDDTADQVISAADGRPVHVADGDSFRIEKQAIRLNGIDAVEYKQFCTDRAGRSWSCGVAARDALAKALSSGGLRCTARTQDQFGRHIAHCRTNQIPDVAAELVRQGWAVSENPRGDAPYADEQAEAEEAGRGIWAGPFERPRAWRDRQNIHPIPVTP